PSIPRWISPSHCLFWLSSWRLSIVVYSGSVSKVCSMLSGQGKKEVEKTWGYGVYIYDTSRSRLAYYNFTMKVTFKCRLSSATYSQRAATSQQRKLESHAYDSRFFLRTHCDRLEVQVTSHHSMYGLSWVFSTKHFKEADST